MLQLGVGARELPGPILDRGRAIGDDAQAFVSCRTKRAGWCLQPRADLGIGREAEGLEAFDLGGLHLVQHVVAADQQHHHFESGLRLARHDDDRLHRLLDRQAQEGGDFLAGVLVGRGDLLHRRGGCAAGLLRRERLGKLDVGGVIGCAGEGDRVLAGGCEHLELMRAGAADLARVGRDRAERQPQAREDARVGVIHLLVALLQTLEIGVERVGVLHRELARAHHAEARPDLVAELGLDLVEIDRQLAVAADLLAHDIAEHLLGRGRVAELALGAVLDAQHQRAVEVPAPGLLPQLRGLDGRREHLEGAGAIHLLAHDALDLLHHAQPQRHPRVQAARELADEARAQHQLVAHQLGFLGGFLEGGEIELRGAHEFP